MSRVHRVLRVTGGKVAFTNTSRIPDEKIVKEIRALAKVIDMDKIVVHFKKHGRNRWSLGYAYNGIPDLASMNGLRRREWRYLIVVTDSGHWHTTLAHEAKHVEQYKHGKNGSEPPCRAFEAWWARKREAA